MYKRQRVFTLGGPIEQKVEVDELRGKHAAGTAAGSVTQKDSKSAEFTYATRKVAVPSAL